MDKQKMVTTHPLVLLYVSTNTVTPAQNETHHWELARTQVTKCLLHGNVVITDNYNTNFPQKPRSQNGKLL